MDDIEEFLLFPEFGENKAITGQKRMSNNILYSNKRSLYYFDQKRTWGGKIE